MEHLPAWGAFGFGAIIGWFVYFINRYRKGDVGIGDITAVIGAVGGATVTGYFGTPVLFGAYGIGLAVGFFGYFFVLILLVAKSQNFDSDWFLDGRRKDPPQGVSIPGEARQTVSSMSTNPDGFHGQNPGAVQNFYIAPGPSTGPDLAARPQSAMIFPRPMAAIDPKAQRVIDTCRAVWPNKKDACNFFVAEVANQLGVVVSGTADNIVDQISGAGWTKLADGPTARDAARQGKLVLAGIKAADFTTPRPEGHVAVVVVGDMNPGGWAPAGYWGSLNADIADRGGNGSPISLCFRLEDKDKIVYASKSF